MKKNSIFIISFLIVYSSMFLSCVLPKKENNSRPPGKPQNVKGAIQPNGSLKITWTEPTDKGKNADGSTPNSITFIVELIINGIEKGKTQGIFLNTDVQATRKRLHTYPASFIHADDINNQSVTIRVYAKNDVRESAYISRTITYHASKVPDMPTNIVINRNQQDNSLTIVWKHNYNGVNPNGIVAPHVTYKVELINEADHNKKIEKKSAQDTKTVTISVADGLISGTTYTIKVYAENKKGYSNPGTKNYTYN